MIKKLRLLQIVHFNDVPTEFFEFKFGFVIPGSTNTWQQVMDSAEEEEMMSAEVLSGNLLVEVRFFDDEMFICLSKIRIFYV